MKIYTVNCHQKAFARILSGDVNSSVEKWVNVPYKQWDQLLFMECCGEKEWEHTGRMLVREIVAMLDIPSEPGNVLMIWRHTSNVSLHDCSNEVKEAEALAV